jgi:hypothetical protein
MLTVTSMPIHHPAKDVVEDAEKESLLSQQ